MERGPLLRTVASLMFPFIAGVFMAGAIGLQYLAHGAQGVPGFLRLPYRGLMALGLLVSLTVGSIALVRGFPFLTSFHASAHVPILGIEMEMGLAQAFDAGIFLLVVGGMMTAVLALREE